MFVDTHVHLNDPRLDEQLDSVLGEAKAIGVTHMVCVGFDKASSARALAIASSYEGVYAAVGFHPSDIKDLTSDDYLWLENIAKSDKVVAIGEIGYDYYWDKTSKEAQTVAFERQLEIAKKVNKPVIIHMRDATDDTYQMLKKHYTELKGGIMHAYSGSASMASEFIKLNLLIGVGGVITFKNGKRLKEVVEQIDLKHIVTETDAPYLTPEPFRGKTNYPKYIPIIASEIARIKKESVNNVSKQVLDNAQELFNI